MSFSNKVILVTGASGGIGAAIALEFGKEGADVAIIGRNQEKLKRIEGEFAKIGKKPLIIKADVAKDNEAKTIVKQTIDVYGKLDILVNNAGIVRSCSILDNTYMETFDTIMTTNIRAVALITNLAAPYLVETKGNIINISSVAARKVSSLKISSYEVSKAALNHFTRCTALELAPAGVRVNSVSPGPVKTDIVDIATMAEAVKDYKINTALNRVGEPEEIADLVLFLASDKAKSITGSDYVNDNVSIDDLCELVVTTCIFVSLMSLCSGCAAVAALSTNDSHPIGSGCITPLTRTWIGPYVSRETLKRRRH